MAYSPTTRLFVLSDSPDPPTILKDKFEAERRIEAGAAKYLHEVVAELTVSEETIRYILDNPDGLSQPQLARKLGVSQSLVAQVQLGKKRQSITLATA